MPLLRERGARVRRLSVRGLRHFRLHHLQLSRSHALQVMSRETSRATNDPDQDGEDRLARALSESVTAIAAIAPMLCESDVRTTQVSQLLHGHIAQVVERNGLWLHVKGADGYPGWIHQGYVAAMPEPVPPLSQTGWDDPRPLSLGCTVRDEHGATRKLPLGALVTEGQERFGGLAMTLEERRKVSPSARFDHSSAMIFSKVRLTNGRGYTVGCGLLRSGLQLLPVHGVHVRATHGCRR